MKVLGLIPARLGSKGVPLKNLRPLAGRALINHTIDAALASRLDRVVVSTEAEEIADVARKAGADVPFMRPGDLADDFARAIDVIIHALDALEEIDGSDFDCVMYLQPTSPFRQASEIDAAIDLMETGKANSVLSVTASREHPSNMYQYTEDGRMKPFVELDHHPERRQDIPAAYDSDCAIFLSKSDFLREGQRHKQGLVVDLDDFLPLEVGFPTNIDIDTWHDFLLAEFAMQNLHILRNDGQQSVPDAIACEAG